MKQTLENRRINVDGPSDLRRNGFQWNGFGRGGLESASSGSKFFGGIIFGAVIGAIVTYYADTTLGRSRRAKLRDKGRHYLKEAQWQSQRRARDIFNRTKGLAYEASHRIQRSSVSSVVDDETLLSRVRSTIGHKVSHPRSIHVDVKDGCVTLSGVVLSHEAQALINKTRSVPGVRAVVSRLDMHSTNEHIPGLQ